MPARNRPPEYLPAVVRDHPEVVRACREWNVGRLFRIVQNLTEEPAKFTGNYLARRCQLTPAQVSGYIRNEHSVQQRKVIERIADGLHLPGDYFGLPPRPWETGQSRDVGRRRDNEARGPMRPAPGEWMDGVDEDDVKRRELLGALVGLGLTPPTLAALGRMRRGAETALSGAGSQSAGVDYAELAVERYGYGYHGQAPTALLADMANDFNDLRPLLAEARSAPLRIRMCRSTAALSGMIGIVLHDLGSRREAHGWFRTASVAAQETGDRQLMSWILAREAMVPLNFGAPQAAADLATKARAEAGGARTASAALACAVAGRAQAILGRPEEAGESLAQAESIAESLTGAAAADTWFGYPEQKHHVHASQILTRLGSTTRAYESQEQALRLTRSPHSMSAALLELDRATCLHRDGETDEACRHAHRTIAALPQEYRTDLVLGRARDLLDALPARRQTARSARELDELVRSCRQSAF